MKPAPLALVWLVMAMPVAAGGGPGLVEGDERARILAGLQAAQQSVATLRASVVQRKRDPLLKEDAVREGTLLLERPGRLRWEVHGPEPVTVIADGPTLLVYRPDRQEAERRDLREDVTGRAAMGFLMAAVRFDLRELEKRFEIALHREPGGLRLTLTPRSRWLARGIAFIEIVQQDADPVPRQFVMAGPRGDRTETRLGNLEINAHIPEEAFALRLGPEVRVLDVRRAPDGVGSDR